MKVKTLAIFFYLLYLLAMVKPLIPIVEYYANYNYIVTELCENKDKPFLECNGKCYLAKELNKVNHDDQNHESNVPKINFDNFPVILIVQIDYSFKTLKNSHLIIKNDKNCIPLEVYQSVLKPPKIA
ncbi:hypothetical protein [Lutibacter sp.]|uniref:hypothetical protein n=1 Tax=Lutibacter sp. TaxID=1925666 RepID=UPI0025C4BAF0|nr:hypothetical protein [Lutibacter sp.]MCF6180749.1 hypothetical protein [Lutibacter sp.]